jgi:hypothetical protein
VFAFEELKRMREKIGKERQDIKCVHTATGLNVQSQYVLQYHPWRFETEARSHLKMARPGLLVKYRFLLQHEPSCEPVPRSDPRTVQVNCVQV